MICKFLFSSPRTSKYKTVKTCHYIIFIAKYYIFMQNKFVTLQYLPIFVPLKLTTMKLAILPNWCKWISLALFISAFIIDFENVKEGLLDGYYGLDKGTYSYKVEIPSEGSLPASAKAAFIFDLIVALSIIVFILSKDKRDDDFINVIRAKALLSALLLSAFVILITFTFRGYLDGISLLLIHFLLYITIFKILKIRADFATIDE